jgi:translation initiation factor IF-1
LARRITGKTGTHSGIIREKLPQGLYRVECDDGREVTASVSTQARQVTVKLIPGDRVTVQVSPYDPGRGRITRRET